MKRRQCLKWWAGLSAAALASRSLPAAALAPRTGWVFDQRFLTPVFQPPHPEQPRRVQAIVDAVGRAGLLERLLPIAVREDVDEPLRLVHTEAHIASVRIGYGERIDALARAAVGGVIAAIDAVHAGDVDTVFVCSRPPGHHARNTGREEGFCFYNHVSVGARYAQRTLGLARVLIIDWDYHHGDGTEMFFYEDPTVLVFSTHDLDAFPRTGYPERRGAGAGEGFNINVPLPCGATDHDIEAAFRDVLLPAADAFRPDLVLVSAGFDSRRGDLLGCFDVTDDGYRMLTGIALDIAQRHCGGRLVSVLEGGYNAAGTASAVVAHVSALAGLNRHAV